jgi:DNA topoisomerase-1
MIDTFYKEFHPVVENVLANTDRKTSERTLGTDPKSGKPVTVKIGRFGPIAQIGTAEDEEKPRFASLKKTQFIDSITLEEALDLFKMPRTLGEYEGKTVKVAIGRFGPYIQSDKFYSLPKEYNPETISLEESIKVIEQKREDERNKFIKAFGENNEYQVLNGRFGAYISFEKKNYKIPKTLVPAALTEEQVKGIVSGEIKPEVKKKAPAKKKAVTKKK